MRVYLANSNSSVTLPANVLGRGGQGAVYVAPHGRNLVIKVWDSANQSQDSTDRATALCRWLQRDPRLGLPIELVLDGQHGNVIGFVMPRLPGVQLFAAFNPVAASHLGIQFEVIERLSIAAMLADLFDAIHQARFLVIDANEANFLVEKRWSGCQVYGIDCDSYEFEARDQNGQLRRFRTDAGKEEYLAPELQGMNLAVEPHTKASDHFSLAVLIWLLLKGGAHPFLVRASGGGSVPPLGELIRKGHWPYSPTHPIPPEWEPVDAGIPWDELPPKIQALFIRAFREGHADPQQRPTASEWRDALAEWVRREREANSIAGWIIRAFRAIAKVKAAAWLSRRIRAIQNLFGWRRSTVGGNVASGRIVRVLLVILLLAFAGYALLQDRGRQDGPKSPPNAPEWRETPHHQNGQREPEKSERWQGAPRLWKELVGENEGEGK